MSIEVIRKVNESEKNARENKIKAAENAKKAVSEAERAGQKLLMEARAGAEAQVKQFMKEAEEKAEQNERSVMEETAHTCDTLRLTAKRRMPEAAQLIVRRVVNV